MGDLRGMCFEKKISYQKIHNNEREKCGIIITIFSAVQKPFQNDHENHIEKEQKQEKELWNEFKED